jgi:hypothetical protein
MELTYGASLANWSTFDTLFILTVWSGNEKSNEKHLLECGRSVEAVT